MTPTTHLNSSLRRGLFGFVVPTLLCAGLAMSQTTPQSTPDYPDELASAMVKEEVGLYKRYIELPSKISAK